MTDSTTDATTDSTTDSATDFIAGSCNSPTGVAPVLQLHPTRLCNLACAHCYTSSGPGVSERLDISVLLACLRDAAQLGYRQLAVSGGEPLLYPDLAELLVQARALGMLTSITTNGMLATAARWPAIGALLDVVAVSIDGTAQEHDAIRGQHGAFAKTLNNLAVIRASGVPFGFIFTLTQYNVDSLEFIVKLAAEQGARSVQVHPLTLSGRAIEHLADARPDAQELFVGLAEAARLGQELGVAVHVDALSWQQVQSYRSHLVPSRPVTRLTAIAPVLVVQADGMVLPLTHDVSQQFWLGNLHQTSLSSLAQNWLHSGVADRLALACEQSWNQLSTLSRQQSAAVYWYDVVAASSRQLQHPSKASSRARHTA
ncbi:radical SAM protein [Undibacterium sp. Ren11W]|uniref:radical SAM protein n=1 Tax=Undibacterium sp. Ren11W TaxID=3413045 RepID=UPI003BF39A0C